MIKKKKLVIAVLCTFCLAVVMFNVTPVRAQATITILPDGSISPSSAPIQRNGNVYTLTGNIISSSDGIEIERSNIIIDGAGYTVQSTTPPFGGNGFYWTGINNVTVKRANIQDFYYGIFFSGSSNNSISGNNITNNGFGIFLSSSSNNIIFGNNLISNIYDGIWLASSSYNSVIGNNITDDRTGITISYSSNYNTISGNYMTANNGDGIANWDSSNNIISGNNITANQYDGIMLYMLSHPSNNNSIYGNSITANNRYGIYLYGSLSNSISGNNVANNNLGIYLNSSGSAIYHNNFINNIVQVVSTNSMNIWDNGYPSGGNYWSDSNKTDLYRGAGQNITGSDGICDKPYVIDTNTNSTDNYPLVYPWKVGDATYDGKVNVLDLIFIATRFGTKPGDLSWNPRADVKEDGTINVLDLIFCATHLGK